VCVCVQAYLSGNKRLAKDLGAQGRWHNDSMKAAHAAAASEIFSRRNAHASAAGTAIIDLHGLHVNEALQQLARVLGGGAKGGGGGGRGGGHGKVQVVVGVGQHGKVPARLPSAVKRWLEERGCPYTEPFAGLLEVSV
jgi:hypothetical protein